MLTISLTRGLVALIDDEDARLAEHKWYAQKHGRAFAAGRKVNTGDGRHRLSYLHREVLGITDPDVFVDHANGDSLDCRRSNLRIATVSQNGANRGPPRTNSSGFKGVTWNARCQKWQAQIGFGGFGWKRTHYLGVFATAEDAARAYDAAAKKYHGEFARPNALCGGTND